MRITREFKCLACHSWCASCCNCCSHELQVEAPVGEIIGYVRQRGSCWKPKYEVLNQSRVPVLLIKGPCCFCRFSCCCDKTFRVILFICVVVVHSTIYRTYKFIYNNYKNKDNRTRRQISDRPIEKTMGRLREISLL